MLKNDKWIKEQAGLGMITPFESGLVRQLELGLETIDRQSICEFEAKLTRKVLSYGCGSYGYDLRLSPQEFYTFKRRPGVIVNPKKFCSSNLEQVELQEDKDGQFFIIPANSYALGVALEKLNVPPNITVVCIGKSSYARCGIIANVTPAEAGWKGFLTLEFSNASSADCRIYANEGVLQLLFLEGEPCETTYHDRSGKYQNQGHSVTFAKV